jgi:serine phosphatase RsbU (regulator of sigma subunit)
MEIQIAVAKINRHDTMESGDTLEFVERPNGGISVVMADARSSGHAAKAISSSIVHKVISMLADGVRDGAAARAASDMLYTERNGQTSAYLNILSVDLQTCTLVICRNNPTPIYIAFDERIEFLSGESTPIGVSRNIRPAISEIALETGITIVTFTDGILNAGRADGQTVDIPTLLEALLEEQQPSSQSIADTILAEAIRLDRNKPNDDMSLIVLRVLPHETDTVRRVNIRIPYKLQIEN